eukprot:54013_1
MALSPLLLFDAPEEPVFADKDAFLILVLERRLSACFTTWPRRVLAAIKGRPTSKIMVESFILCLKGMQYRLWFFVFDERCLLLRGYWFYEDTLFRSLNKS